MERCEHDWRAAPYDVTLLVLRPMLLMACAKCGARGHFRLPEPPPVSADPRDWPPVPAGSNLSVYDASFDHEQVPSPPSDPIDSRPPRVEGRIYLDMTDAEIDALDAPPEHKRFWKLAASEGLVPRPPIRRTPGVTEPLGSKWIAGTT